MSQSSCLAINGFQPILNTRVGQRQKSVHQFGAWPQADRIKHQELISLLKTGTKVPEFTIPTDRGKFKLADNAGKNVVVFFFPRADTSGCTTEAIAFSGLLGEFAAANCVVIGISKDTAAKQGKFRAKHGLTVELGADDGSDICEQFGVWAEKSMYGKSYMGIQRATFVIGADGKVAAIWPKVKLPRHAEEVLEAVRGL